MVSVVRPCPWSVSALGVGYPLRRGRDLAIDYTSLVARPGLDARIPVIGLRAERRKCWVVEWLAIQSSLDMVVPSAYRHPSVTA